MKDQQPHTLYLPSENVWVVVDVTGKTFVARYQTEQDALDALNEIYHQGRPRFRIKSYLDHAKENARRAAENGCAYLTFQIEVKKNWKGGGSIYCPQMKYESRSRDLAKDVAMLVQEFIDVEGGEQL